MIPASLHKIPPADARLCLEIEKFSRNKLGLKPYHRLAAAFSTGADSTALLLIFYLLQQRLQCGLCALHINHHLRSEAETEEIFAKNLCKTLNIPLYIFDLNLPLMLQDHPLGIEETARNGRLKIFADFIKDSKADFILLAHHANDLNEDIILRLLRGSGWPALGGMKARENFILRPLLRTPRKRLRQFLANMDQTWMEDSSNQDLTYKRNRIRHKVMPLLEKENPELSRRLGALNDLALIDDQYWSAEINKILSLPEIKKWETPQYLAMGIPARLLRDCACALRLRIYHKIIKKLHHTLSGQNLAPVRADAIFRLEQAVASNRGGTRFQFPGGSEACIEKGQVIFKVYKNHY